MMLTDYMTYTGPVFGCTRIGLANVSNSPLHLSSFEKTSDILYNAAYYGQRDSLAGPMYLHHLGQNVTNETNLQSASSSNRQNIHPRAFDFFSLEAIRSGVNKVLSLFKSRELLCADLVEAIREYSKCEDELKLKKEVLESSGIEESDPDHFLEKVKERGHGHRAQQELEQWKQLLLENVSLLKTAIEKRRTLLTVLDQSSGFYETQFREVTTVLKAYHDSRDRIITQKRRCQDMMNAKFQEKAVSSQRTTQY
ncbi:Oidioi.mRNA.OKI2018_I69.YSR.g17052.t1.cds [Oikopleura dioica]|uniref:Oidioi.mRNA.OKI2018_I69.YSR.g17052.t1.cds n=1 Tax=Oikopleura dioica TaxID=34765 RepID=A0ABN7SI04_OIKDI|nr:Oidioi.mRNA.OKI2018_I69.YSR.g17052.t1.cds [Oikopleura dioica]